MSDNGNQREVDISNNSSRMNYRKRKKYSRDTMRCEKFTGEEQGRGIAPKKRRISIFKIDPSQRLRVAKSFRRVFPPTDDLTGCPEEYGF